MALIERIPESQSPRPKSFFTPRVLGLMFAGLILVFVVIGLLVSPPISTYFLVTAGALTPWFLIICFYFARDRYRRRKYLTGH